MLKHNKGIKVALGILFFVGLIVGIFTYLLKWNSSYVISNVKVSAELVDKMRNIQGQGGKIELGEKEVNEIIGMYVKGNKSFSGLMVKGIEAKVQDKYITLNIPAQYKGIDIFVSSKGTLTMRDDKIQYELESVYVGKIQVPKKYVLNKLKNSQNNKITVEQDKICFNKSLIPINIKLLEIKEGKIGLVIDKSINNLEEKLNVLNKKAEDSSKKSGMESAGTQQNNKTNNNKVNDNSTNQQSSYGYNDTKNKLSTSEMDAALDRISSGLNAAMSSVSSGGQKSVVSEMISAANSMKGNPNANPYEYAGSARSTYKSLSPQEKSELKSAVFSNVNGEDVNIVTSMLQ